MKDKLLVCTFSGGRTSAFMGLFLKEHPKYKDFDKVFIFANTGKELPETLNFINKCDKEWNLNVVWLESVINHEKGVGSTFKVVDYETASRNGTPFEEMLKKYSLPTNQGSHCTRELKSVPIDKFVKSLGYKEVYKAIGIRYDERHRVSMSAEENNIIYPLINDIRVDNKFIRDWWDKQPFDLQLKDYEGNCDLCFKKSLKKRLTIAKERPESTKWWQEMEEKYSRENQPRFDIRTNVSIEELAKMAEKPFTKAQDIHELSKKQCDLFEIETDCFCKSN
jgi:3'-phosphoadenosine 5'-phosphosulfate sulfotransferase (PAPS reductase)/FAD synthetase